MKTGWYMRHHEFINCTLHLSRPFFRPPVAPVWTKPAGVGLTMHFAITQGMCLGALVGLIGPRTTFDNIWAGMTFIVASIYIARYRRMYPRMMAHRFRERIHGQV